MPPATRCFQHGAPRIELPPGTKVDAWFNECIEGIALCVCGQPWSIDAEYAVLATIPEHETLEARDRWMRKRLGIKLPAPVVKTPEDVSARWYFITFTTPDTVRSPELILKNVRKVIKSKQVSPISWCYSLELTAKGTPHAHIALYTEKYFDYKNIKKFNVSPEGAQWVSDIQQEKWDVKKYVLKERTKPSAEWLVEHGLETAVFYSDNFPEELKPSAII